MTDDQQLWIICRCLRVGIDPNLGQQSVVYHYGTKESAIRYAKCCFPIGNIFVAPLPNFIEIFTNDS